MILVGLLFGLAMLVAAFFGVRAGLRGLALAGRALRHRRLPVAALREGSVEVRGRVLADGEPLTSLSGHRCVAVKMSVEGKSGADTDSDSAGSRSTVRTVPVRLADDSGTCRLDLELSALTGERWTADRVPVSAFADVPWMQELVPEGATHLDIEEEIIPEGATVLVLGDASLVARSEVGDVGYREVRREQWSIAGTADHLLVIALGGQARLVGHSVAWAGVLLLVGAYLAALGFVMLALAFT